MKRTKVENHIKRQLLTALIVSKDFLAQSSNVLDTEIASLREDALFYLIAEWCLIYYEEFQDAPKAHIETIYHNWSDKNQDEDLGESVHDLLSELSGSYETEADLNVPFLMDALAKFLTKKKLQRLQEALDGHVSLGNVDAAIEAVTNYRSVEVAQSAGTYLQDMQAWKQAFAESATPLITFPGAAGKFFNNSLTRDAFIAIQAPEKRGKTFWLIEFAMRALRQRKKVAIFECGDLSQNQLMMRFGVRLTGMPLRKNDCGDFDVPSFILKDKDEDLGFRVKYDSRSCKKPVTLPDVRKSIQDLFQACGIPENKHYLKISVHPNDSINVKGIDLILDRWSVEEKFVPDVILVDYADILAPEAIKKDERNMINDTWKALRRLSQQRHALVVTGTQANAQAYDAHTQGMKHFNNDKRKYGHVTGTFALNQSPEEKEAQVMRLNWIVLRESPFSINRCLYVGTCFGLGRAITCSTL